MKYAGQRNITVAVFLFIFAVGSFFRLQALGSLPPGLTNDEAEKAYDAWSLVKTGKDQWGVPHPFPAFKGFGDWRTAGYTYLALPVISLMGPTERAVRLPSAVSGILSIGVMFLLASAVYGSVPAGLAGAFLLAVNPWHIALSRVALESNVSLLFLLTGTLTFLYGLKKPNWFFLSAACFGLSLYMYTSEVVFVPLFALTLGIISFGTVRKYPMQIAGSIVIAVLLLLPLVISRTPGTANTRLSQVSLTRDTGTIDVVNERQGSCREHYPSAVCQISDNRYVAFATRFFSNYLEHFSPRLLFTKGTDTQFSVMPPGGFFGLSVLPLMLIGLYAVFGLRSGYGWIVVAWALIAPVADSLTGDGHYGRYSDAIPAFILLGAGGAAWLLRSRSLRILGVVIGCAVLFETMVFSVDYTAYYPKFYSKYSHFAYRELSTKLFSVRNSYDRIIVSSRINDEKQYIFYLLYNRVNPADFQNGMNVEKIQEADGWVRVSRIDNLYFLPSLPSGSWVAEHAPERILLVGAPGEFSPNVRSVFEIRNLRGDVDFIGVDAASYTAPAE